RYKPTGESIQIDGWLVVAPRMATVAMPAAPGFASVITFGAEALRSRVLVTPRVSSSLAVMAVVESGISCSFSSRRWAVTTISSSVATCEASACCPCAAAGPVYAASIRTDAPKHHFCVALDELISLLPYALRWMKQDCGELARAAWRPTVSLRDAPFFD